uniref:Uncharacterized protein n=1 Tax=viral metagenome TaxID=1070528 RepID=A0A6C0LBT6_9ZZZZ
MKFLLISLLFLSYAYSARLTQKKLCRDCKHFIASEKQCALFGKPDLIVWKDNYDNAMNVRENECGEIAIYFEKNKFKFITVPYYSLKNNWPIYLILPLFAYDLYLIFLINT